MNSYNEIENDILKAVLIKVETLQKEYEVTLQQYQEAGKNYISALEMGSTNIDTNTNTNKTEDFISLKGRSWWGTKGLKEGTVETEDDCKNMCASQNNCSGATFNPVKHYCWTRSGDSSISVGRDNDYALVPKQKAALIVMKRLNEILLAINEKIRSELTNIKPEIEEQLNEKNEKQQQLNDSYQRLLEQKVEMERQLQEYNTINEEVENQGIFTSQQNVSLRFWVLITCLVLLVTLKRMVGSDSLPISITIWFFIIIILIVLTYSLSTPSGFMMWFLLLLGIILIKTGNLFSL
jgi:hypothetical protein